MRTRKFCIGLLIIVMGILQIGWDNNVLLNGEWIPVDPENYGLYILILNNGNFEYINPNGDLMHKGTYTLIDNKIINITTHIHGRCINLFELNVEDRWYTQNELLEIEALNWTDYWMNSWFGEDELIYSLDGNKLTLISAYHDFEYVNIYNRE